MISGTKDSLLQFITGKIVCYTYFIEIFRADLKNTRAEDTCELNGDCSEVPAGAVSCVVSSQSL
jgi:hypothetical protein